MSGPRKYQDLIADTHRYKAGLYEFFLDLEAWREFRAAFPLTWTKVRFEDANHAHIPQERGIYAFTLALEPSDLPGHGYILYVGITGDDSRGTLQSRYSQYLGHLRRQDGRPKVYYMLERWRGDLFFSFIPIPDRSLSLAKLESALLSAVKPPVNQRDLEARASNAMRAAF